MLRFPASALMMMLPRSLANRLIGRTVGIMGSVILFGGVKLFMIYDVHGFVNKICIICIFEWPID